jgi:serine protease Do
MKREIGDKVTLSILRNAKLYSAIVEVGERPEDRTVIAQNQTGTPQTPKEAPEFWRGIEVSDITSDIVQRFNLTAESGVIIVNIQPASPAEQAGLRPGDVIYEINRDIVRNKRDYEAAISRVSGDALIGTYRGYVILKEK